MTKNISKSVNSGGRPSTYDPIVLSDDPNLIPLDSFGFPDNDAKYVKGILVTRCQIKEKLEIVARKLWDNWDGKPMIILCVMNGAARFFELFIRCLNKINIHSDIKKPFLLKYLKVSNYQGDQQITNVQHSLPDSLKSCVTGKHFLAVEDIVDTGHSMTDLMNSLNGINVLSKQCLSMVTKRTQRSNGYVPNYSCYEIPDNWVVGFGLDFNDRFRHYDHICILSHQGLKDLNAET